MLRYADIIDNRTLINSYGKEISLLCDICDVSFQRSRAEILNKIRRGVQKAYCSRECQIKSRIKMKEYSCVNCQKTLIRVPSHIGDRIFCSHSCAATFTNKNKKKRSYTIESFCLNCKESLKNKNGLTYCNHKCHRNFEYQQKIAKWLSNEEVGTTKKGLLPNHISRYIWELYKGECSQCSWNIINPITNKVPLNIHHKDGNYENNKFDNLELLCPNCHSLTSNFGNLNKGKGRSYRNIKSTHGDLNSNLHLTRV